MQRDRIFLFQICLRDAKRRERKVDDEGPINMSMSGVYITHST